MNFKNIILCFLIFYSGNMVTGASKTDSLSALLEKDIADTAIINVLNNLSEQLHRSEQIDSAFLYVQKAKTLALKLIAKEEKGTVIWQAATNGLSNTYNIFGMLYRSQGNYDQALENYAASLKVNEEIGEKERISNSYNYIGIVYGDQSNYSKALAYFFASLEIVEELGDKQLIANSYNNIGLIYWNQGNYEKALESFLTSLKITEDAGTKYGMAPLYNNIGLIYWNQGNFDKALENYVMCMKILEEKGDKKGVANSYNNIGLIYHALGNFEKTMENLVAAMNLRTEMRDKHGMANSHNNIGSVYYDQGNLSHKLGNSVQANRDYQKALGNYFTSLKIHEAIGAKEGIAAACINIGELNGALKQFSVAKKYLEKGLSLSKEIGSKQRIKGGYRVLSKIDSALGNWKTGFEHHKLYTLYHDSIFNEESSKQIADMQTKNEADKKDKENQILSQEKEIYELTEAQEAAQERVKLGEIQRRNLLQYTGIAIGLLLAGVMLVLFVRLKMRAQYVEVIMFVGFMVFFEFLIVLLDPWLEGWTGGAPLWKLCCNTLVAAFIFPAHQFFEELLKKKLLRGYTERKKTNGTRYFLLLLTISSVLGLNSSFSTSDTSNKIDSLKSVLQTHCRALQHDHDTICVNTLNDLSGRLGGEGDYESALQYAKEAVKIVSNRLSGNGEQLNHISNNEFRRLKTGLATAYNNIGFIHAKHANFHKAMKNYFVSLKIYEEIDDKYGIGVSCINIGQVNTLLRQYSEAKKFLIKGLSLVKEIGTKIDIKGGYRGSYKLDSALGNWKSAYEYHKLFALYNDSIFNEERSKQMADMQTRYETEKKEKANEILRQEKHIRALKEQQEEEAARKLAEDTNRRNNLQYSVIAFVLAVILGFLMLAGKLKVSEKVLEGLIFFTFLLFFEFLLVLTDPYMESLTGGAPGWKLLVNAGFAGIIFPMHAFFERKLKKRLGRNREKV